MSGITHHTPDSMLAAYAAGTLPHPFAIVVAAHISMCATCRASLEAHQAVGGLVLEDTQCTALTDGLKSATLAMLDDVVIPDPVFEADGIFPGPLVQALKGRAPQWKKLGMGVRQDIIQADRSGSVRLLYIPPGQAVPDHGHNGLELTLVLQGSFHDETGTFGVGDLEVADETLDHTPIAGGDIPCICLAATDAPLRFHALIPRLLQPLFRI
ncbi:anti-ECFsigma factor, ChrR [Aliiroseovarius halocynthiae]|uniref:Transcriptional regulator n=1 Tax=Aliiroseovarius halocynthiae TaxID=985055 RepID=A0A545SWB4_9RHOB|nr:ChrR family anti-sigma-E factor [Aliiroseovarius halocynthiae]TQV69248.1 transcriptional regulator [Aliiroseovarius halocynthiae]SMR72017.1 anti-ECFsigma factor, ChrR [Aliiroseovarius halocynthiae]